MKVSSLVTASKSLARSMIWLLGYPHKTMFCANHQRLLVTWCMTSSTMKCLGSSEINLAVLTKEKISLLAMLPKGKPSIFKPKTNNYNQSSKICLRCERRWDVWKRIMTTWMIDSHSFKISTIGCKLTMTETSNFTRKLSRQGWTNWRH